jgi:hypothetical protein
MLPSGSVEPPSSEPSESNPIRPHPAALQVTARAASLSHPELALRRRRRPPRTGICRPLDNTISSDALAPSRRGLAPGARRRGRRVLHEPTPPCAGARCERRGARHLRSHAVPMQYAVTSSTIFSGRHRRHGCTTEPAGCSRARSARDRHGAASRDSSVTSDFREGSVGCGHTPPCL